MVNETKTHQAIGEFLFVYNFVLYESDPKF
jgi:hypothetical protein